MRHTEEDRTITLISFDIDGTMVFGSPPGTIEPDVLRQCREKGIIVGSASDRPISNQIQLWEEHGIEVDFVSLKHKLDEIKERFGATHHLHIGDTEMDRYFAKQAGFHFHFVHELPGDSIEDWLAPVINGQAS